MLEETLFLKIVQSSSPSSSLASSCTFPFTSAFPSWIIIIIMQQQEVSFLGHAVINIWMLISETGRCLNMLLVSGVLIQKFIS